LYQPISQSIVSPPALLRLAIFFILSHMSKAGPIKHWITYSRLFKLISDIPECFYPVRASFSTLFLACKDNRWQLILQRLSLSLSIVFLIYQADFMSHTSIDFTIRLPSPHTSIPSASSRLGYARVVKLFNPFA
jgi:hypothetical protein